MQPYLDLLRHVLQHGTRRPNRTGVDTIGVFGTQTRYNLREGFPAVTTKRLAFRWVAEELAWILRGSTDVRDLQARGVTIWDEWATPEQCAKYGREPGDIGPSYGHQLRCFGATPDLHPNDPGFSEGYDQLAYVINEITSNPSSRRILFSLWHPEEAQTVTLPPCHVLAQFFVSNDELSCCMFQRSADLFLGAPFNIASYSLLTHLIARECNLGVGEFVHTIGDAHVYTSHLEQVTEQLSRAPRSLPRLVIDRDVVRVRDFDGAKHATLLDYNPHPSIAAPVAV